MMIGLGEGASPPGTTPPPHPTPPGMHPFPFPRFFHGGPFGFGPYTQRVFYMPEEQQPRWLVPVLVGLVVVLALRGGGR